MKEPIAIIGMSGLFPKAESVQQYWKNIIEKVDCITDVPSTHWDPNEYFDPDPQSEDKTYCKRGGFIPEIKFDPMEFGIPPTNLEATDTSQLLALYCAKEALIDAGYWSDTADFSNTGIILGYSGYGNTTVPLAGRLQYPIWKQVFESAGLSSKTSAELIKRIKTAFVPWQENSFPGFLGNVVAGRIANRLNLGGMNCIVDAACASSIAALKLSIEELRNKQCDMVISGGVDTNNSLFSYICFSKTPALSKKQDATPFDAAADGMLLAEGIGMLVLKRLSDAERDQDYIYALIKGVGSSSDGKHKSIYSTRPEGQVRAILQAYKNAEVQPEKIGLIEAHAPGTRVGDSTEISALKTVFTQPNSQNKAKIAIGSVKSQIGHTKSAAGVSSIIKVALALDQQVLPATIKLKNIHPNIDLSDTPLYINTEVIPWIQEKNEPRRAGVSSFGFGGTNFHIVLEEYQNAIQKKMSKHKNYFSLIFSENTKEQLIQRCFQEIQNLDSKTNYFNELLSQQEKSTSIPSTFARVGIVAASKQNTIDLLHTVVEQLQKNNTDVWNLPNIIYRSSAFKINKLVAVFPGQGSQYPGMLTQLGLHFSAVRDAFENFAKLDPENNEALSNKVFSENTSIHQTENAQPVLGIASKAYYTILSELGFAPDMTLGHSFGELSALWAAGCFEDDDYLFLANERGRSMMPEKDKQAGGMLAVSAAGDQIISHTKNFPALSVVNFNSPNQCVVSGCSQELAAAKQKLEAEGFHTQLLSVSNAFHTPFVEHAVAQFSKAITNIHFTSPKIPVICNATNANYPKSGNEIKRNLVEAIAKPVYFEKNIQMAYENGCNVFVEIGPKRILSDLIKQILVDKDIVVVSLGANSQYEEEKSLHFAITQLRVAGVELKAIYANQWQLKKEREYSDSTINLNGASYVEPATKKKFNDAIANPIAELVEKPVIAQNDSINKNEILELQKYAAKNYMQYLENQSAYLKIIENMQTVIVQNSARPDILNMFTTQINYLKEMQAAEEISFDKFFDQQTQQLTNNSPRSLSETTLLPQKSSAPAEIMKPIIISQNQNTVVVEKKENLSKKLFEIIANSTGYPPEAIDIQMDLEADLGIDSIKRVEIFNQLSKEFQHAAEFNINQLAELRTIRAIIDYLESESNSKTPLDSNKQTLTTIPADVIGIQFSTKLIKIIADSTGYPAEAIDTQMDLEADLGIDSIKRVEILNQLQQQFPNSQSIDISRLAELKSIQNILDYLNNLSTLDISTSTMVMSEKTTVNDLDASIKRYEIIIKDLDTPNMLHTELGKNTVCIITGETTLLIKEYMKFLKSHGMIPIHLTLNDQIAKSKHSYYLPNIDEKTVLLAIESIQAEFGQISGFLHIHPKLAAIDSLTKLITEKDEKWTMLIFSIAKNLTKSLATVKNTSRPFFMITTYSDGSFGTTAPAYPILGQALSGFCKSLQQEWGNIFIRYINFHNQIEPKKIVQYFQQEIFDANNILGEVAYTEIGQRICLAAKEAELIQKNTLDIQDTDVILVTGGGRGITAACIKQLAKQKNAIYIIVGRTDISEKIPEALENFKDEMLLKKTIFDYLKNAAETVTPKQVERYYRKIVAIHEIKTTLEYFRSHNITVEYIQLDIASSKQIKEKISKIQHQYGVIKGLIHGAGNLADKYIENKTIVDYKNVVDTKVKGLTAILSALTLEKLNFVVLFSSVVGFYGNAGQTDYAIANEVLNKVAYSFSALLPSCKVVAINWGPWSIGMVNSPLMKYYDQYGIKIISEKIGAEFFLQEILHGLPQSQIIIGQEMPQRLEVSIESILPVRISQKFNPSKNSFLLDHVVGNQAVFPMTFILDWIINSTVVLCKGYSFSRVEDFKVFNGITWDKFDLDKTLFLDLKQANNTLDANGEISVEAVITIASENNLTKLQNYRAHVILTKKQMLQTENLTYPKLEKIDNVLITHDQIYPEMQFHGSLLQLIEKVTYLDKHLITGSIRKEHKQELHLFNPYLADAALQFINLWSYQNHHMLLLPLSIKKVELFYPKFTSIHFVQAHCELVSDSMVEADVFGYDENYRCIFKFHQVHTFSNAALSIKYKQNNLIELESVQ